MIETMWSLGFGHWSAKASRDLEYKSEGLVLCGNPVYVSGSIVRDLVLVYSYRQVFAFARD